LKKKRRNKLKRISCLSGEFITLILTPYRVRIQMNVRSAIAWVLFSDREIEHIPGFFDTQARVYRLKRTLIGGKIIYQSN